MHKKKSGLTRWQLHPAGFILWMSCMFTLCVRLAGQKTIFLQYILSFYFFLSVCHGVSSYSSVPSLPFLSASCPLSPVKHSPLRLSLSADFPLMLVCTEQWLMRVKNAGSCLFSQSAALGAGCLVIALHLPPHTRGSLHELLQYLAYATGEQLGVTMNKIHTKKLVMTSEDCSTRLGWHACPFLCVWLCVWTHNY